MAKRAKPAGLPSEAALLDFIQNAKGKIGKREIAREFGISGNNRVALKALLKSLEQNGKLARKGTAIEAAGNLPPVAVLTVTQIDSDGELMHKNVGHKPVMPFAAECAKAFTAMETALPEELQVLIDKEVVKLD